MTAIPSVPERIERLDHREVLVEIGLKASLAATAFSAVALAIRLSGTALVLALLGCALLAATLELCRRRAVRLEEGFRTVAALACCSLLGFAVAELAGHGGLLFLPCLFVLATIAVLTGPGLLLACSALVATGFLAPTLAAGQVEWSSPFAAAALIALPLAGQWIVRRVGSGRSRVPSPSVPSPSPDLARLTPRQAQVTTMIAEGLRHQEIADRLGVSLAQVRRLVRQARERIGARTTTELVARTMSGASDSQAE